MATFYLGQIEAFAFGFPPKGWALCQGQLMAIAQNAALFSLLGTQFGGNGINTFALPDLRGRVGLGFGQGPNLNNYNMGEAVGEESHTLVTAEMPGTHTHAVNAQNNGTTGGGNVPGTGAMLGCGYSVTSGTTNTVSMYASSASTLLAMTTLTQTGGQPHENRMPFGVLNYCICLQGLFPSRN